MSAPAQKARVPAPVSTIARQLPRSSSSQRRARSAIISRDIALGRGRLPMVITTTWRPCSRTSMAIQRSATKLGDDHDLAVGAAIGQQANRLDALLERQTMRDARLELALLVPGQELVDRPPKLVGLVPAEIAQRAPERGPVLHQQPIRRNLLNRSEEHTSELQSLRH